MTWDGSVQRQKAVDRHLQEIGLRVPHFDPTKHPHGRGGLWAKTFTPAPHSTLDKRGRFVEPPKSPGHDRAVVLAPMAASRREGMRQMARGEITHQQFHSRHIAPVEQERKAARMRAEGKPDGAAFSNRTGGGEHGGGMSRREANAEVRAMNRDRAERQAEEDQYDRAGISRMAQMLAQPGFQMPPHLRTNFDRGAPAMKDWQDAEQFLKNTRAAVKKGDHPHLAGLSGVDLELRKRATDRAAALALQHLRKTRPKIKPAPGRRVSQAEMEHAAQVRHALGGRQGRSFSNRTGGGEESPHTPEDLKTLPLYELAGIIQRDWGNVNFGAKPYLQAMGSLESHTDNYGADSGSSIVHYFLGNATAWRGPTAKAVKAELKRRVNRR